MESKTTEQIKNTKWANWLLEELQRRTGRKDIEVTASSYSSHDVLISIGTDKHPIVSFYSVMQGDSPRVTSALDYASEMLQNWEATTVLHEKANQDCRPFYERLRVEFPHMLLTYNIVDSGKYCSWITKTDNEIVAFCDLWPTMTEDDIKRLITHIKELEDTLHRENATYAEVTYWWQ